MKKLSLVVVSCFFLLLVGSCKCEKGESRKKSTISAVIDNCKPGGDYRLCTETAINYPSQFDKNDEISKQKILFTICMKAKGKLKDGDLRTAYSYATVPELGNEGITETDLYSDACLLNIQGTALLQKGKSELESNENDICKSKKECLEDSRNAYKKAIEKLVGSDKKLPKEILNSYIEFKYRLYNNYALLMHEKEKKTEADEEIAKTNIRKALVVEAKKDFGFICPNALLIGLSSEELTEKGCNRYNAQNDTYTIESLRNKPYKLFQYYFTKTQTIPSLVTKYLDELKSKNNSENSFVAFIYGEVLSIISNLKTGEVERVIGVGEETSLKESEQTKERRISINSFTCTGDNCKKYEYGILNSLKSSKLYRLFDSQDKLPYYLKIIADSKHQLPPPNQPLYFDITDQTRLKAIEEIETGTLLSPTHLVNVSVIDDEISFEVLDVKDGRIVFIVSHQKTEDLKKIINNELDKAEDRIPDIYNLGIYYARGIKDGNYDDDANQFIKNFKEAISEKLKHSNIGISKDAIKDILKVHKLCAQGVLDYTNCVPLGRIRELNGVIFLDKEGKYNHVRVVSIEKGTISASKNSDDPIEKLASDIALQLTNSSRKGAGKNRIKFDIADESLVYETSFLTSKILDEFNDMDILESLSINVLKGQQLSPNTKDFFNYYYKPTHCLALAHQNKKLSLVLKDGKDCTKFLKTFQADLNNIEDYKELNKALNSLIIQMKAYPAFSEKVTVKITECRLDNGSIARGVKLKIENEPKESKKTGKCPFTITNLTAGENYKFTFSHKDAENTVLPYIFNANKEISIDLNKINESLLTNAKSHFKNDKLASIEEYKKFITNHPFKNDILNTKETFVKLSIQCLTDKSFKLKMDEKKIFDAEVNKWVDETVGKSRVNLGDDQIIYNTYNILTEKWNEEQCIKECNQPCSKCKIVVTNICN